MQLEISNIEKGEYIDSYVVSGSCSKRLTNSEVIQNVLFLQHETLIEKTHLIRFETESPFIDYFSLRIWL